MGNNRDETIRVNYDVGGQDKIKSAQDAMRGVADAEAIATAAHEKEEVSLDALSAKYAILERGIGLFKELALTVGGLVAFEKVKEEIGDVLDTGDKFEKWGIQFKNAFGGADAGAEAFEKIKTLAEATPESLDVVADAAIKMRKQGLDPLDGSLQTLIDTNAKYGGSSEQLSSLIDSFSRAAARGSLNTRLLIQLQENGVPAAKLLGDAMGFTADQINNMAAKGELGRSAIDLLLKQLAQANSGAAAAAMGTLSSQVTKLRDQWDEFLELIAKSGAYDFAKDELRQVGEAIQQGLADGSLQEKAQAISDAIVGIGKAAISVIQFLNEHASAIRDVAAAYAVLKAGSLAGDILKLGLAAAQSAEDMLKFGGAAKVAAGATAEVQASAAAARSNLISMALALAAFDAVKIYEVADALRETRRVSQQEQESLKEAADIQGDLFQKSIAVINQTRDAANVAVVSAEALKQQSVEQSAAYTKQLQDAIRYYTALRIQAQQFGNTDDVKKYTDKLRELTAGLSAATAAHEKVAEAVQKTSASVEGAVKSFDKLRQSGASSAEAVQGAFDKVEIHTPEGLDEIEQKLTGVEGASNDAKDAIGSELVGALEKLNAADLANFQQSVTRELAQGKGNAEALTQELQSGLEAELLKLGVTAERAGVKFTQSGQQIITEFRAIAENAEATGQQINDAFEHALSQAKTVGEVQALKAQLKAAFDAGKIGAAEFARATEEAANALLKIQLATSPVEAAMRRLQVTSQASLQATANQAKIDFDTITAASDGSAQSIANQQNAFLAYAKARLAASEQLGPAAREQVRLELANEAALLRVSGAFNDVAKNSASSAAALTDDADRSAAALDHLSGAADKAGHAVESMRHASDDAKDSLEDLSGQGGESLEKITSDAANARAGFLSMSQAAANLFDTKLVSDWGLAFDSTGAGVGRFIEALNQATAETNAAIADQRHQLDDLIGDLNNAGTAGRASFGDIGQYAGRSVEEIQGMIDSIKNGTSQFNLLGEQDLSKLLSALDAAKQKAQAAADAAKQAAGEFDNLAKSIHDQLLQEQGDQQDLENERHQEQLDKLKELAESGQIDAQKYAQAVADENALHELKLKHLEEQKQKDEQNQKDQQQRDQNQQSGGGGSGGSSNSGGAGTGGGGGKNGGGGQQSASGGANGGLPSGITHHVHITVNGNEIDAFADQQNADALANVIQQLRFAKGRS